MKNTFFFALFLLLAILFSNCTTSENIESGFTDVEVVFESVICCSDIWTMDSRLEEFQLLGFDKIIFDSGIEKAANEQNITINQGDRFLIDFEITENPNCFSICDSVTGQHISITKIRKL